MSTCGRGPREVTALVPAKQSARGGSSLPRTVPFRELGATNAPRWVAHGMALRCCVRRGNGEVSGMRANTLLASDRRRVAQIRILIVIACACMAAGVGGVASASVGSAVNCKTIIVTTSVRKVTTRTQQRVCETAQLAAPGASLPCSGGTATITIGSSNATACTLGSSPGLWSGQSPVRVRCAGSYSLPVPATSIARSWNVMFAASNQHGQAVTTTATVTQQGPPVPPSTARATGPGMSSRAPGSPGLSGRSMCQGSARRRRCR